MTLPFTQTGRVTGCSEEQEIVEDTPRDSISVPQVVRTRLIRREDEELVQWGRPYGTSLKFVLEGGGG